LVKGKTRAYHFRVAARRPEAAAPMLADGEGIGLGPSARMGRENVGPALWPRSEHLKLVTHRVPESDVERTLRATWLHRLLGKPAKPFAQADGRNARHHNLSRVGRCDLR
jgi:hypothetical protein